MPPQKISSHDGPHKGLQVASRPRSRHHRLRDLRLQTCPAAARCRRDWNAPIAKIITPRKSPTFLAHAGEDQAWFAAGADRPAGNFRDACCRRTAAACWISAAARDFFCRPRCSAAGRRMASNRRARPPRMRAVLGAAVTEGFFDAETAPRWAVRRHHISPMCWSMCPIPIAILQLARDLLEPGGVLCVDVPNDFSPLQIAARGRRRRRRLVGGAAASSELFRFRLAVARC